MPGRSRRPAHGCSVSDYSLSSSPTQQAGRAGAYKSNPDVNPPVRQKLVHHRALVREHVRVLPLRSLRLLLLAEPRARVVDHFAVAGGHDAPLGVRGGPKFVGLFEDARVGLLGRGRGMAFGRLGAGLP